MRCTCKVVVLSTKPIVVFDVLLAVASSDRKVAINSTNKERPGVSCAQQRKKQSVQMPGTLTRLGYRGADIFRRSVARRGQRSSSINAS